jgi:hypothetical protein
MVTVFEEKTTQTHVFIQSSGQQGHINALMKDARQFTRGNPKNKLIACYFN